MNSDYKHSEHFSTIAPRYHDLRTTNVEPVSFIARQLESVPFINAVDVGCGTGRYTSLLLQHLQDKSPLIHCVDYSVEMLKQLRLHFMEHNCQAASTINASSPQLPFQNETLNCVFTFNAIHHFGLWEFLDEATRVLQDRGHVFVYTRLRSQNSRNIWGRYFPLFTSKETRLYELDELENRITETPGLTLKKIKYFKFKRKSDLADLIHRAQSHHYSTFDLYSVEEFNTALEQFSRNLSGHFNDLNDIQWFDENVLLILQKTGH